MLDKITDALFVALDISLLIAGVAFVFVTFGWLIAAVVAFAYIFCAYHAYTSVGPEVVQISESELRTMLEKIEEYKRDNG